MVTSNAMKKKFDFFRPRDKNDVLVIMFLCCVGLGMVGLCILPCALLALAVATPLLLIQHESIYHTFAWFSLGFGLACLPISLACVVGMMASKRGILDHVDPEYGNTDTARGDTKTRDVPTRSV